MLDHVLGSQQSDMNIAESQKYFHLKFGTLGLKGVRYICCTCDATKEDLTYVAH